MTSQLKQSSILLRKLLKKLINGSQCHSIWIGKNEISKYWLTALNDIQKRGIQDVLIFAIDDFNGFNEAIVYPKAEIQRCIVHQNKKLS